MTHITVSVSVKGTQDKVWQYWTEPEHIMQWNFASDDWECPAATNDVRAGGKFSFTMAAKDGSVSFDFTGIYSHVKNHEVLEYAMPDGRKVKITFTQTPHGIHVEETFDPEHENPLEMQKTGWQAILNNFKKHVER